MESKKTVKVKLFSDRRHYTVIEVYEDEVEKVREANRMTWQEDKEEERRRKRLEKDGITLCSLDKTDADGDDIPDGKMNAEEMMIENETERETYRELHNAIKTLKPRQQKIIYLVYFQNVNQKEVAEKLGITESALSHALSVIYDKLKKYFEKK